MRAKEKEIISHPQVLESRRISALISETIRVIAEKQAALAGLPDEKRALLGEPVLNVEGVTRVDRQTQAVTLDLADLETRVQLLRQQQWAAEKCEAGERLQAITTECEQLGEQVAHALSALEEAEDAVLERLRVVVRCYLRHLELVREKSFLTASYRLGLVTLPALPEFAPLPQFASKVGAAMQPLLDLRLRGPLPRRQPPKSDSVFEDN
jgi:hypothetical protein